MFESGEEDRIAICLVDMGSGQKSFQIRDFLNCHQPHHLITATSRPTIDSLFRSPQKFRFLFSSPALPRLAKNRLLLLNKIPILQRLFSRNVQSFLKTPWQIIHQVLLTRRKSQNPSLDVS